MVVEPDYVRNDSFPSQQIMQVSGKTRDLFKKIRDTKGTFHAKMGTIKDRNVK